MTILKFIADAEHSGQRLFWKLDEDNIPEVPGVYLLVASGGAHFLYPKGRSPVYYIGQSSNLRSRLRTHLKYARQARDDRKLLQYYPRYEYAAAFGGRYVFAETNDPKNTESLWLARFAARYRSFPVANSAASWRRIAEAHGRQS